MKTIIVFDLKDTLVQANKLMPGAKEVLQKLKKQGYETKLYSMNESWTYEQLIRWPDFFAAFDSILLVSRKQRSDLEGLRQYRRVLVVGDGLDEEIAFAKQLNYEYMIADRSLNSAAILGKALSDGSSL